MLDRNFLLPQKSKLFLTVLTVRPTLILITGIRNRKNSLTEALGQTTSQSIKVETVFMYFFFILVVFAIKTKK